MTFVRMTLCPLSGKNVGVETHLHPLHADNRL